MIDVVGVRFRNSKKIYYFDPGDLDILKGDEVIVETVRGNEYGYCMMDKKSVPEEEIVGELKKVVRKATEKDTSALIANEKKQEEAFLKCKEKIEEHKLEMKLISAEYSFDGSKLTFYFTAENRIDFRELVKDLASVFRTRIELRQIGVRDEAKLMGGLGKCGLGICCKSFLPDFQPVSIKMAKEQKLSLNPTKISGLCGRLMCCLNYEEEYYEDINKVLPRDGATVMTPEGEAIVLDSNALTQIVRVKITLKDGTADVRLYPLDKVKIVRKKCDECSACKDTDSEILEGVTITDIDTAEVKSEKELVEELKKLEEN